MRLPLDSHALLWWMDDSPWLGASARRAIGDPADVAVSLATIWEIAIKAGLGKLSADLPELLANSAAEPSAAPASPGTSHGERRSRPDH
jgi:PIN domain nuclease of toxin-antitoxin system